MKYLRPTRTFTSSLGAGGRYDAIIGKLVGRDDIAYPTVGMSFGMESIMELLKNRPAEAPGALACVIPIGDTVAEVLHAAALLRKDSIRTRIDTSGRKLKKSLAAASAQGIRYVILIGENEAALGNVLLKDMDDKTELVLTIQESINIIYKTTSAYG